AGERLRRLQKDHDLMKVEAPAEGLVYYGQSQWGQWTTGSSVAARLRQGGRVSADEVVMTIVDPETLFVRATVPEKELWQVRRGLTGTAEPVGYDRTKLPASIDAFSAIPTPDGKYLATVLIDSAR